jgi:hypothetical protein
MDDYVRVDVRGLNVHAEKGIIEKLTHISTLPWREYKYLAYVLAKHGHVDAIDVCVSKQHMKEDYFSITYCMCRSAAFYGQTDVLIFLLKVMTMENMEVFGYTIWNVAINGGQFDTFKWCVNMLETYAVSHPDYPLQVGGMIKRAVSCGRSMILTWLLERGYRVDVGDMVIREHVPKSEAAKVRIIAHEWKLHECVCKREVRGMLCNKDMGFVGHGA